MKISANRKWILFLGIILPLLAYFGTSRGDSQYYPAKKERSGRVQRYVLDNGLIVLLKENHFAPVTAMSVWVKVGSADERPGEEGLAHVHEHMLFKGTERRGMGEIANEVEGAGGDINAFTSLDETVYYITMPSRKTELGIDILDDAVFHSTFDPEELKKELQVVLEEIKRGEDNPSVKLSHLIFGTAYKVHPYRLPIIGTEQSVSAFTREDVVNFYHRWYTPDNMVLVVVGDINSGEISQFIEKTFGAEKAPNRKKNPLPSRDYPLEPPQAAPRVGIIQGEVQEGYLDVAFHIPSVKDDDAPALEVLAYILGSGESSRLYRTVQAEKGLVHSIYAASFTPRDPGLFFVSATLDGNEFQPSLKAIFEQIDDMKNGFVLLDELTRAKTNIESESIFSKETVQGEARKLGYNEAIVGDVDFDEQFVRKVNAVTAEDVRYVARKYLAAENVSIGAYLPKNIKKADWSEAMIAELARADLKLKPSEEREDQVAKVTLSNGMTLIVKENHAVPIVAMRAAALGGVRLEPEDVRGINNFIARTLAKGTAKRSAEDIAAEVDSIAGSMGGFSGRDSIGLAGEFLSKNFDQGLDLFADILLNPTFTPKEVEQQRREIIAAIKHIEDSPEQLTIDLFRRTIYPRHPYGSRTLGNIETIEKLKRKDLMNYYREIMTPQNIVLAVVGDVRMDEIAPKIEKAFQGFKGREFTQPQTPASEPLSGPKKVEITRDKEQAQIIIGFRGASFKSQDRYALDVLAAILSGQGGRLFVELRDKRHLAYSVGAVAVQAYDPGFFFFYIGTRPENRDQAIQGIMDEIAKIRSGPVDAEELERAKEYIAGTYEVGMQTDSSQAAGMSLNERYGMGWEESQLYPKKIRQVTAQQVLDAAKKYLNPQKYVQAVLVPSGNAQPGGDQGTE